MSVGSGGYRPSDNARGGGGGHSQISFVPCI